MPELGFDVQTYDLLTPLIFRVTEVETFVQGAPLLTIEAAKLVLAIENISENPSTKTASLFIILKLL